MGTEQTARWRLRMHKGKKKQLKEQCTQRDKHECTMNIAGSLIEQNVSYSKSPALNKTKV